MAIRSIFVYCEHYTVDSFHNSAEYWPMETEQISPVNALERNIRRQFYELPRNFQLYPSYAICSIDCSSPKQRHALP
jgi:hypothetical protein